MLWAQFQPQNEAEAAGFFVGVMLAGLFSGGIPFFTGLAMKQTALGIAGGVISALAGALAGCCLGVPVAMVFTVIIVVVAQFANRSSVDPRLGRLDDGEYDDYVRSFRRRIRKADPDSDPKANEKSDDVDAEWQRRAEDRDLGNRNSQRRPRPDRDD